jgi:hypothetical protein
MERRIHAHITRFDADRVGSQRVETYRDSGREANKCAVLSSESAAFMQA